MTWLLFYEIVYIVIVVLVCIRIIWDTRTPTKTLAYLLLVIFAPVIGIFFYFSFGINYRKRKLYSKKLFDNEIMWTSLKEKIYRDSENVIRGHHPSVESYKELAYMLLNEGQSMLTANNNVKLLINGENKFPEVLDALSKAKNHIHIEYYIYENDATGRAIEKILVQKVKEGVTVRFIYDDFGSHSIRRSMVHRLRTNGVKAFPFFKVKLIALANRLNYRNHRKIIIVDGRTAFVGGINVSDKYVNNPGNPEKLFWRDTHLRIDGEGVRYLQYLFLCDWNFCAGDKLHPDEYFFPQSPDLNRGDKVVQIAASGPDSEIPVILFSLLQAIYTASKEILITTPYLIPGESILDALIASALGGVQVKILVPGNSDSVIVNAAAYSYYDDLLKSGAEIYLYKKGFVHAKTLVADRKLSVIGTANMDHRSFDLNFEVNAVVYDETMANELSDIFYRDIMDAEKIDMDKWNHRPVYKQLVEKMARLVSPML